MKTFVEMTWNDPYDCVVVAGSVHALGQGAGDQTISFWGLTVGVSCHCELLQGNTCHSLLDVDN